MRRLTCILIAGLALAAGDRQAAAQAARKLDPANVPGTVTRQLLLRQALDKHVDGTLVAELNRNREIWQKLTPEQRRHLRDQWLATINEDPARLAQRIKNEDEFNKLNEQHRQMYLERAVWLKKVVDSLSPEQREEIRQMTPEQRARRLLDLKARLGDAAGGPLSGSPIGAGPTATGPATGSGPASLPTTRPARTVE